MNEGMTEKRRTFVQLVLQVPRQPPCEVNQKHNRSIYGALCCNVWQIVYVKLNRLHLLTLQFILLKYIH